MASPSRLIVTTLALFLLAGLLEISGGYCIWLWLREDASFLAGILGCVLVVLYGFVPTFQPARFHRVYGAYGGIFIGLSILWGWVVDGVTPDRYDLIGASVAMLGGFIIFYWPSVGRAA